MKAGLYFADRITHRQPDLCARDPDARAGLRPRRPAAQPQSGALHGILNAVDDADLESGRPTRCARVATTCAAAGGQGHAARPRCSRSSASRAAPDAPLFAIVSRLTEQKGLRLVLGGLDALLAQGGQLALLGSGDGWLEERLPPARRRRTANRSA